MKGNNKFNRRVFLRGAGGLTIWLPLEYCLSKGRIASAQSMEVSPKLITYYFPNGCQPDWWNYTQALSTLTPMKNKIAVLQGVKNSVSEQFGRDAHEQGGATLFTGDPVKNNRESTGISLD